MRYRQATLSGGDTDAAGRYVANAGDVDADGIPDVLVGGPQDGEGGGTNTGAAWLVLGSSILYGP